MARTDELSGLHPRRQRRRILSGCLAGAALAHLALLGLGSGALRQGQRDRLPARPVSTPAAVKVRHLSAPAAAAPLALAAASAPAASPAPPSEPATSTSDPAAASAVEPAVYVPRGLLSVAPVARTPVLLQWPPNWPLRQTYTAVLKLYLDEQGRVERVEPDGDAVLPGPLFESARLAFMAADFTPGQLNGQAVKSWFRIEVSFETAAAPVPP